MACAAFCFGTMFRLSFFAPSNERFGGFILPQRMVIFAGPRRKRRRMCKAFAEASRILVRDTQYLKKLHTPSLFVSVPIPPLDLDEA